NAGKNALFARQPAAYVLGIGLAHGHQLVHRCRIVDLRQVLLRPLADARDARALAGPRPDEADGRIVFLEEARHARDGAGLAHGADEVGDATARLLRQLGPGGIVVDARVVGVGELVEDHLPAFAHQLVGQVARVIHATALGRE